MKQPILSPSVALQFPICRASNIFVTKLSDLSYKFVEPILPVCRPNPTKLS